MKPKAESQTIIDQIASEKSPVGMDAVYVHAVILDRKRRQVQFRLSLVFLAISWLPPGQVSLPFSWSILRSHREFPGDSCGELFHAPLRFLVR